MLEVGSEDEAPRDVVVVGAAVELSSHGEEANVVFCSLGSPSRGLSRLRSCVRHLTVRRLIIRCRLVTLDPADRAVEVGCHFFDLREFVCSVRGHARRSGWNGPKEDLQDQFARSIAVSIDSTQVPAQRCQTYLCAMWWKFITVSCSLPQRRSMR